MKEKTSFTTINLAFLILILIFSIGLTSCQKSLLSNSITKENKQFQIQNKNKLLLDIKIDQDGDHFVDKKYTCEGQDINPRIIIEGRSKYYAIYMYDPDAPYGTFVHWIAYDIKSNNGTAIVKEGSSKHGKYRESVNDFRRKGYNGPCPPKSETHRYFFMIYGYNKPLNDTNIERKQLLNTLEKISVQKAEVYYLFSR